MLIIDTNTDALLVIDAQKDFCEGGTLPVIGGNAIMAGISRLALAFNMVVLTQDWHPLNHKSFAVNHGVEPFTEVDMPYGKQTAWPVHCAEGSDGAEFHPDIAAAVQRAKLVIRKGYNPDVDSYSAFYENDRKTKTGLTGYLRDKGIKRVILVGLAYDFCVAYSALDAIREGFEVVVIKDLTAAINMPIGDGQTTADMMEYTMIENGVRIINSNEIVL